MKFKRFTAAVAATGVLAAPAIAATTQTEPAVGGDEAPKAQTAAAAKKAAVRRLALKRNVHLARLVARLEGERLHPAYARKANARSLKAIQRSNYLLRREVRQLRRERSWFRLAYRKVPKSTLDSIAYCESHRNPRAIGGGGSYRGAFQMTFHIWSAVGGKGDPVSASLAEQYYRAALIYTRYGSGQWPVCGR
jgi:hypothetical protein